MVNDRIHPERENQPVIIYSKYDRDCCVCPSLGARCHIGRLQMARGALVRQWGTDRTIPAFLAGYIDPVAAQAGHMPFLMKDWCLVREVTGE